MASHIIGNAALAGAPEEREAALVGVEHHLLRLARIGAHEHHAAVAEPDVGDLHRRRHAVDDDDLVAPVELVGFARRERQRHVGFRRRARVPLSPAPRIAANRVVAALVAESPQLLVNADQRQPLARRRFRVRRQQPIKLVRPRSELRPRLDLAFIRKRRLPDRKIRRTVLRDRCSVRAISLIDFPLPRCSRVSVRSSPQSASPTARFAPKQAADQTGKRGVNFGRR